MEKLNSYLQLLMNNSGQELRLEPNKQPTIKTGGGTVSAASTSLPGAQINAMIFSLIPDDVKKKLPSNSEVSFVHPHTLGAFSFSIKKSPAGFVVTIAPDTKSSGVSSYEPEAAPSVATQQSIDPEPEPFATPKPVANPTPEVPSMNDIEINSPLERSGTTASQESSMPEIAEEYKLETASPAEEPATSPEFSSNAEEFQPTIEIDYGQVDATPSFDPVIETFEPDVEVTPVSEAASFQTTTENVSQSSQDQIMQNNQSPVAPQPANPTAPATNTTFTPAKTTNSKAIDALFVKMAETGASDLHLSVSMPPLVRKDGKIAELTPGAAPLNPESMEQLITSIMPEKNIREFEERNDTDFAYEIKGLARFRANVFRDRKGMGGVFRIIPSDIMTAEDLNLSKAIMDLCNLTKGLVVVTGPTGSGKSTTLCAMVDSINKQREDHIITIEDPIEFTHENQKCLVNQREVHNHTDSFKDALRAALREDPDILLVGEMRDLETISIAIETAETGHLVFGTLHTTTAASTVDRIIDQFPADRQQQVRVMLSESLKGVIAQTLLPKIGGGRIAALEVLIVTPAIANLIREGKTFQIPSQMQTGKNIGMVTLNDALMDLVNKNLVTAKDAYIKSVDKENFETLLKRNGKSI